MQKRDQSNKKQSANSSSSSTSYDDNEDFLERLKFADDIENDEEMKGIE